MDNMKCCVARDLLPLYIDGVLSGETAALLQDHLEACEDCRREYRTMAQPVVLPTTPEVQKENSWVVKDFKRTWTIKTYLISLISVVMTLTVLVFAFFMGRELLFDKSVGILAPPIYRAHEWKVEESDGWIRLTFQKDTRWYDMIQTSEKEKYLEFSSNFSKLHFVNTGYSSAPAEMRVLDVDGNVVVKPFILEAGKGVYLQQLNWDTPYIVEFRGEGEYFEFSFS